MPFKRSKNPSRKIKPNIPEVIQQPMKHEDHQNEPDELKDAPILRSLKHAAGFPAPEGYFDQLSSAIQNKINSKRTFSGRIFTRPVITMLSLATMIVAIFFIYTPTEDHSSRAYQTYPETEISTDDLISTSYYLEIEEELLAETLRSTENGAPLLDANLENYLLESYTEAELVNEL